MNDKFLHLACGLIIATCGAILANPLVGFGCSIIAGLAKELYDKWDYGIFDIPDLLATIEGGAVGALLMALLGV